MDLIIIRHGLPERVDLSTGVSAAPSADPGLTEVGRAQARAMAEWLRDEPIDATGSSMITRPRRSQSSATPA